MLLQRWISEAHHAFDFLPVFTLNRYLLSYMTEQLFFKIILFVLMGFLTHLPLNFLKDTTSGITSLKTEHTSGQSPEKKKHVRIRSLINLSLIVHPCFLPPFACRIPVHPEPVGHISDRHVLILLE